MSGGSPHDALFRLSFASPGAMRGVLRARLPAALLQRLDLERLEQVSGSLIDEELRAAYSDLLFTVPLDDERAHVYVLVEHKSSRDRWVALQLLRYMVRIWEREQQTLSPDQPLPPIIPVLVVHAEHPWSAPPRFGDLLVPRASGLPELARLTPHFDIVLDDLSRASDEELQQRGWDAFTTAAAFMLRDGRTDPVGRLLKLASLILDVFAQPGGPSRIATLYRYALAVSERPDEEVVSLISTALPETKDVLMTTADMLINKGVLKGRSEGRTEGRTEGRRETLRRQLELKFGSLPASVIEQLGAADDPALDGMLERILTATSLEQVLGTSS